MILSTCIIKTYLSIVILFAVIENNTSAGRDIYFEWTDGPREQHVSSYRRVKHI